MPDPGHLGFLGSCAKEHAAILYSRGIEVAGRHQARPGSPQEEAPSGDAVGPLEFGIRVPESAGDVMWRHSGKWCRADTGAADYQCSEDDESGAEAHGRSVLGDPTAEQIHWKRTVRARGRYFAARQLQDRRDLWLSVAQ